MLSFSGKTIKFLFTASLSRQDTSFGCVLIVTLTVVLIQIAAGDTICDDPGVGDGLCQVTIVMVKRLSTLPIESRERDIRLSI